MTQFEVADRRGLRRLRGRGGRGRGHRGGARRPARRDQRDPLERHALTSIALEHTELLGDTEEEIAGREAGGAARPLDAGDGRLAPTRSRRWRGARLRERAARVGRPSSRPRTLVRGRRTSGGTCGRGRPPPRRSSGRSTPTLVRDRARRSRSRACSSGLGDPPVLLDAAHNPAAPAALAEALRARRRRRARWSPASRCWRARTRRDRRRRWLRRSRRSSARSCPPGGCRASGGPARARAGGSARRRARAGGPGSGRDRAEPRPGTRARARAGKERRGDGACQRDRTTFCRYVWTERQVRAPLDDGAGRRGRGGRDPRLLRARIPLRQAFPLDLRRTGRLSRRSSEVHSERSHPFSPCS